jgi:hypothetical protein
LQDRASRAAKLSPPWSVAVADKAGIDRR